MNKKDLFEFPVLELAWYLSIYHCLFFMHIIVLFNCELLCVFF